MENEKVQIVAHVLYPGGQSNKVHTLTLHATPERAKALMEEKMSQRSIMAYRIFTPNKENPKDAIIIQEKGFNEIEELTKKKGA